VQKNVGVDKAIECLSYRSGNLTSNCAVGYLITLEKLGKDISTRVMGTDPRVNSSLAEIISLYE